MTPLVGAILIGLPLAWLTGFAAYAYFDAPNHDMNRTKWALIAFIVPLFGFFAYLFERAERTDPPEDDDFTRGAVFEIHDSRRGEDPLGPGDTSESDDTDDEWNDPPGIDL